jgi:soluble lytic murein transglycosylase
LPRELLLFAPPMRGIGFLPRSVSRVIFAGALLAGGAVRPVPARGAEHGVSSSGRPDETAMVMPRLHAPAGAGPLGLPMPLAPSEAARVRDILARQRHGDLKGAVAETAKLTDQTLLGPVLADRILSPRSRMPASALADWLRRYQDQPEAPAIRALLIARAPGAAVPPIAATASLNRVDGADQGRLDIAPARRAFTAGRNAAAERLGRAAWLRSRKQDGAAAYVAGLAAWRRQGYADAASLFEGASTAAEAGAGLRAAGAFWAARAYQRDGKLDAWLAWMRRAAAEPHVLHGMLARRVLGMAEPEAAPRFVLTQADLDALAVVPAGRRAFALLQVGEPARAEAELRHLWPQAQADAGIARALLLAAEAAGLTGLRADLAAALHMQGAEPALPRLRPRGGYTVNPALVYAVAKVESSFSASAVSPAGAQGLMQLMPDAAALVAGRGAGALLDPGINLRLGQRFLAYLSRDPAVGDNLLHVLVAYNAGPNGVTKLGDGGGDPLLFLETLPCDETRHYVLSALTYMGEYAARLRVASAALDGLAVGNWPAFSAELRH